MIFQLSSIIFLLMSYFVIFTLSCAGKVEKINIFSMNMSEISKVLYLNTSWGYPNGSRWNEKGWGYGGSLAHLYPGYPGYKGSENGSDYGDGTDGDGSDDPRFNPFNSERWAHLGPGFQGASPPPWAYDARGSGRPDYCYQLPLKGFCLFNYTRWGFNPFAGECQKYKYSGCQGSQNNFPSKKECEEACIEPPVLGCEFERYEKGFFEYLFT